MAVLRLFGTVTLSLSLSLSVSLFPNVYYSFRFVSLFHKKGVSGCVCVCVRERERERSNSPTVVVVGKQANEKARQLIVNQRTSDDLHLL